MKTLLIGLGLGAVAGIAAYKKLENGKMCEKAVKCAHSKLGSCDHIEARP